MREDVTALVLALVVFLDPTRAQSEETTTAIFVADDPGTTTAIPETTTEPLPIDRDPPSDFRPSLPGGLPPRPLRRPLLPLLQRPRRPPATPGLLEGAESVPREQIVAPPVRQEATPESVQPARPFTPRLSPHYVQRFRLRGTWMRNAHLLRRAMRRVDVHAINRMLEVDDAQAASDLHPTFVAAPDFQLETGDGDSGALADDDDNLRDYSSPPTSYEAPVYILAAGDDDEGEGLPNRLETPAGVPPKFGPSDSSFSPGRPAGYPYRPSRPGPPYEEDDDSVNELSLEALSTSISTHTRPRQNTGQNIRFPVDKKQTSPAPADRLNETNSAPFIPTPLPPAEQPRPRPPPPSQGSVNDSDSLSTWDAPEAADAGFSAPSFDEEDTERPEHTIAVNEDPQEPYQPQDHDEETTQLNGETVLNDVNGNHLGNVEEEPAFSYDLPQHHPQHHQQHPHPHPPSKNHFHPPIVKFHVHHVQNGNNDEHVHIGLQPHHHHHHHHPGPHHHHHHPPSPSHHHHHHPPLHHHHHPHPPSQPHHHHPHPPSELHLFRPHRPRPQLPPATSYGVPEWPASAFEDDGGDVQTYVKTSPDGTVQWS
ncbi:hypothetical protein FOCC_FOCC014372, partial [Frankliniella occidentalis]